MKRSRASFRQSVEQVEKIAAVARRMATEYTPQFVLADIERQALAVMQQHGLAWRIETTEQGERLPILPDDAPQIVKAADDVLLRVHETRGGLSRGDVDHAVLNALWLGGAAHKFGMLPYVDDISRGRAALAARRLGQAKAFPPDRRAQRNNGIRSRFVELRSAGPERKKGDIQRELAREFSTGVKTVRNQTDALK